MVGVSWGVNVEMGMLEIVGLGAFLDGGDAGGTFIYWRC